MFSKLPSSASLARHRLIRDKARNRRPGCPRIGEVVFSADPSSGKSSRKLRECTDRHLRAQGPYSRSTAHHSSKFFFRQTLPRRTRRQRGQGRKATHGKPREQARHGNSGWAGLWLPTAPPRMRGVVSGAGLLRGSLRGRLGSAGPGGCRSGQGGATRGGMPPVRRSVRAGHGSRRRAHQPAASTAVVAFVRGTAGVSGTRYGSLPRPVGPSSSAAGTSK